MITLNVESTEKIQYVKLFGFLLITSCPGQNTSTASVKNCVVIFFFISTLFKKNVSEIYLKTAYLAFLRVFSSMVWLFGEME